MRRARPATFGRKEAQRSGWGNGGCPIQGQSVSGAELGQARWQGVWGGRGAARVEPNTEEPALLR
jgi:hypothetical protein